MSSWKHRGWARGGEGHFQTLQDQVNRLLEEFVGDPSWGVFSSQTEARGNFAPKVNLLEDPAGITISLELPGVDEKEVDLSLSKDAVTITGERRQMYAERDPKNRYHVEQPWGKFQRVIPISGDIDHDRVDASYKNGILTVVLPKIVKQQDQPRKVTIKTS